MPELPEVEVTRRSIDLPLRGARVQAVHLGKPLRWPLGCPPGSLVGQYLGAVLRRGKYLWLPLHERASAGLTGSTQGLLLHLGMSGALELRTPTVPPGGDLALARHEHFRLDTDRGSLRLLDPRRFGAVVWSPGLAAEPAAGLLARLGLEPDDPALTEARFHAELQRRRAPIKTVLLQGEVIVGAGNIYACEALFHAGIDPRCSAARIGPVRARRLLHALRHTLAQAVELGGTTLRDFHDARGVHGAYQEQVAVYGRAGLPCLRCGTRLRRLLQAQRTTVYCPRCQRR